MTEQSREPETNTSGSERDWIERKARKVVRKFEERTMPRGTCVLYRHPWAGILMGISLLIGFGTAGTNELAAWYHAPKAPLDVSGALVPEHMGRWVRWHRDGLKCGTMIAISSGAGRVFYRPVFTSPGDVVWIAASKPPRCDALDTGELDDAVGANGDTLRESFPRKKHWIYWVGQTPGNRLVGAVISLPFVLLGAFMAFWFMTVGQRVKELRDKESE